MRDLYCLYSHALPQTIGDNVNTPNSDQLLCVINILAFISWRLQKILKTNSLGREYVCMCF